MAKKRRPMRLSRILRGLRANKALRPAVGLGDIQAPENYYRQTAGGPPRPNNDVVQRPAREAADKETSDLINLVMDRFEERLTRVLIFSRRPGYLERPPFSINIDEISEQSVAIAATSSLASFAVPPRHRGIIEAFGMDSEFPADFDDLTFQIQINGTPVQPYESITFQIGTVLAMRPTRIIVQPTQTVTLQVTNAVGAPGAHNVIGTIRGYFYPLPDAKEFAARDYRIEDY